MFDWLKESNRIYHLIGGFVLGALFVPSTVICVALAMEFKDCASANETYDVRKWKDWSQFDKIDIATTVLGGAVGFGLKMLILEYVF